MSGFIPVSEPYILPEDVEFVKNVLAGGQVSGRAPVVRDFEAAFSGYLGVGHALTCSSGTTALHLAVRALGLKRGDEVIVPSFAMMSPVLALMYEGIKPVPVDVDRRYWTMKVDEIRRKITGRTKAVMVVNNYGNPNPMSEIQETADAKGLFLVEDCAESLGATFDGKKTGTFGRVSTFSFFANKLITCGEGGMVCTDDGELAERVSSLRDLCFGKKNKFLHEGVGYNYRMSSLQAALGASQLKRIERHLSRIRKIASLYGENLSGTRDLDLHSEPHDTVGSYWMYSVLAKGSAASRNRIARGLLERGIETRPFFIPVHRQPVYAVRHPKGSFPDSEYISERGLNLPSGLSMREEEIARVCACLKGLLHS